jgi:hypothetical protein
MGVKRGLLTLREEHGLLRVFQKIFGRGRDIGMREWK